MRDQLMTFWVPAKHELLNDLAVGHKFHSCRQSWFNTEPTRRGGDQHGRPRDIQLRGRLGRAARRIAETEYSWDAVAKRYRDIFRPAS